MKDSFSKVKALGQQLKATEAQLRAAFEGLQNQLIESTGDVSLYATSDIVDFEQMAPDDFVYGRLSFSSESRVLRVIYRTSSDDLNDSVNPDPHGPSYHIQAIQDCPPNWLRALATEKPLESLFANMMNTLTEQTREMKEGISLIERATQYPAQQLDEALRNAAGKLGYSTVLELWTKAQAALSVNPDEAVTRASSLLETVCKHILDELRIPLPGNQRLNHLFSATRVGLGLRPEDALSEEARRVLGGTASIVHGVGALRTQLGSAHGAGPSSARIEQPIARLAVNAAGLAATFLMETLLSRTGRPPAE